MFVPPPEYPKIDRDTGKIIWGPTGEPVILPSGIKLEDIFTRVTDRRINVEQKPEAEDAEPYELVNHPKHYNEHPAGIECIDVIEHLSFNLGNAIKYMWRAGLKPGTTHTQDLEKAIWYINREIARLAKLPKE